jgi:hypothetical protein
MDEPFPPQHMDRWSRNERLYHHLLGMGLVVSPIRSSGDPRRIDYLYVSVALLLAEDATEQTAETGVGGMVKRPKIANIVSTPERLGEG